MDLRESLGIGWRNLIDHRLRSALTTLGVIIGVGAVIAFVTLGASLQEGIVGELGFTANRLQVVATPGGQGGPVGFQDVLVFTQRDVERIRDLDGVADVAPQGNVRLAGLSHEGSNLRPAAVFATAARFFENQNFEAGGAFDDGSAQLVVNTAAAGLVEDGLRPGDVVTVQVQGQDPVEATLAGILQRGGSGLLGNIQEPPFLWLPIDPFYARTVTSPTTGEDVVAYSNLEVIAADVRDVDQIEERVTTYLETSSDAREVKPFAYEFRIITSEQIVSTIDDVVGTLTGFITGIALISLVVGAIGIANIMLVSVTERTREIGIMKAVGGQNRAILQLFLVEAVILGVVGAVLGTVVGMGLAFGATRILGLPLVLPFVWFGVAVIAGIVVGIASGLYPAWQAARLDPIRALRYE